MIALTKGARERLEREAARDRVDGRCEPTTADVSEALAYIDALEAERDALANKLEAIIAPVEVGGGVVAHLTAERDALKARVALLAAALRSILHPECDVETCGVSPCEACDRDRASWAKAHAALNDAAGALEGGKP